MKNYSKEGQKLPLFGVGPILIFVIAIVNAIAIIDYGWNSCWKCIDIDFNGILWR